jgi:hypothetical protein
MEMVMEHLSSSEKRHVTLLASADVATGPDCSLLGLVDDNQVMQALVLLSDVGSYIRSDGYWVPLNPDINESDATLDRYDAYDAPHSVVPLWDSAQRNDGRMALTDIYGTPAPIAEENPDAT